MKQKLNMNIPTLHFKACIIALFLMTAFTSFSQTPADSISERIETAEGKLNSLDERMVLAEGDLGKLTKIKVSGYIQAQFEQYQSDLVKTNDASNTFYIRRARVKFTYEAIDGLKFVLQPDFSTGNLSIKDAYAVASLPKLASLSLWAGQFNRPNYEVEYSSSQREILERSRVVRAIYPGEREIGAKLEFSPITLPLKLQFAVLNGNFTGKEPKDQDSKKDIIARAVYSFTLAGVGIDLGTHVYNGGLRAKNKYLSGFEQEMDSVTTNTGSYLDKQWYGGELRFFFDVLGGMSIKGEYIAGKNATSGDSKSNPNKIRKFSGYYAYFIKNVGTRNQFVARYDHYDPNTSLSGDEAGKEVFYSTFALAWQYYLNDNIRFSINYEMPKNETNGTYPDDLKDNVFGIRMQAKF
jgi:phosphate-selective porin